VEQWFDSFLGNSPLRWLEAGAVAFAILFVLLLLRRMARKQYARLAATPQQEFLELPLHVLSRTTILFLLIAALFLGLQTLELPSKVARVVLTLFTIASFWQMGLWATTALLAALERKQRATLAVDRAAAGSLTLIGFMARLTIWSLVLLLTLDNLGIQIKPLLTGLGIGGIAVALAAQNILGDLFASLSITLDRPFVLGDALSVDSFSGTVEYIGIKSTRLRSPDGEQIIMPNSKLLASNIRNLTRATERRVVYTISIGPETPPEQLQKIPGLIRSLIELHDDVRFDRSHFAKVSAASFDFESVYFVKTTDYGRHMDILQDINLRLVAALEKEGIVFAYPAQRLYLEQQPAVQSQLVGDK
jgi:small-conductance mechanosensitive channel